MNLVIFEVLNYGLENRKKIENKILGACFKGDGYNKVFSLLAEQFKLLDIGVPTIDSSSNDSFKFRARCMYGIYDLQAFADVFNQMHPSALKSCMFLTLCIINYQT